MRDESSANSCVSQIPLCFKLFLFALQFLPQELCSLSLDFCDAEVLRSEGVDVGYYSLISQLKKGIVDDE